MGDYQILIILKLTLTFIKLVSARTNYLLIVLKNTRAYFS